MIEPRIANAVLQEALKHGADFSELFLEDTESNTVVMVDGKVENAGYTRLRGAGVRVLKGTRSAYAYTADTSPESLMATARAAAAALPGTPDGKTASFSMEQFALPAKQPFSGVENSARAKLLREATKAARDVSMEITQVRSNYLDVTQRVLICNSEGVFVRDERPRTRVGVMAVAMKDGEAQTGFEGPGCGTGFEAYAERIDVIAAARDAANTAVTMLHAPECLRGASRR